MNDATPLLRNQMNDATLLLQPAEGVPTGWAALNSGVHRGSTVLFDNFEAFLARGSRLIDGYPYGQNGSPTTWELAQVISRLEGGKGTVLVPSGLAATVLVNAVSLRMGDHVLVPRSVYAPTRISLVEVFARWGVSTTVYDGGELTELERHIGPATRLIWTESPGSNTLEMQDIAAIVAIAKRHRIPVAMDNTWATPLGFKPLEHGVTFSVQALTKYVGGHSDIIMGAVTVADDERFRQLRKEAELLGYFVAPDECALALRGIGTMSLRLERHAASALRIAGWLADHPDVAYVNYPPLPGARGHELWKRDYARAAGVLSFGLRENSRPAVRQFVDALQLFRIGASWGGLHSLVAPVPAAENGFLLRLHVGLEEPDELLADLARGFAAAKAV